MCRSRRPSAVPLLLLPLLAAVCAARVHVQSSPADVSPPLQRASAQEEGVPDSYEGHQVLKVYVSDNRTLDLLRSYEDTTGVEFWTPPSELTPTVDVLVSPEVRRQLTYQLGRAGASYTVSIDNVQTAIEEESPKISDVERELLVGRSGHPLTWTSYHSLADHHQYIDFIHQNYKGLCEKFSIGTSTEGRDLKGLKCGLGKRGVFVDGGIHAREWVSPAVVSCLEREFSQNSYTHRELLTDHTVYMLPVLNPDGYEFSRSSSQRRLWRKTRSRNPGSSCIGTDPNRNFDFHWGETGSSDNPCRQTYRGSRPFSEPETRALRDFLLRGLHDMYFSFHSYSQMLFVPYGYSTDRPADYEELERVAQAGSRALSRLFGKEYQVGQASRLLYSAAGGSDDWAKGKAGIKYSHTFELRDKGRHGFMLPASQIEDTCKEIVAAVTTMISESAKKGRTTE